MKYEVIFNKLLSIKLELFQQMKLIASFFFLISLFNFLSINLIAQDAHYWSQTYGTRSTLLGGAVIGSVDDLGATFYNPGNLSLTDDPNFLFSARIFEYNSISITPEKGLGEGVSKQSFRPSPGFVVANLTGDWLGKSRLAFSFLTRQTFNTRLKTRFVGELDMNSVSNEILFEGDSDELWGGITWSYPFKGEYEVGIGITNYVAVRTYRTRNSINIQVVDTSNNVGQLSGIREFDYYNVRLLWKAGIGFTFESIKFGLTITTPSINLFGSGETDINLNSIGIDADGDLSPDEFLISDFQKDLPSIYNSSLAIGFGAYYKFIDFKLHFAAEYYNKVEEFNVLTSNEFQSQTGGYSLTNHLTHALKPVLNLGFGFEYYITKKFTAFGGFITDFSALNTSVKTNHSISSWNIYHLTGGGSLSYEKLEITFGLSLGVANDDLSIPLVPLSPSDEINIIFQQQNAKFSSLRLKFIFGLTF